MLNNFAFIASFKNFTFSDQPLTNRNTGSEERSVWNQSRSRQRSHRSNCPDVRTKQLVHGMSLRQRPEYSDLKRLDRSVSHHVVDDPLNNKFLLLCTVQFVKALFI